MTLRAVDLADLLRRPRPTPEQIEVIEAPLEPLLVVAGAGSGKTETMAARVVWLIANGLVEPDAVLGLTFTRKAAGELAERVRTRLAQVSRALAAQGAGRTDGPDGPVGREGSALVHALARPTVSTYNAYAASLVAEHALRLGIEPSARLLGEGSQWQLAAEVVESWPGDLETDAAVGSVVAAVLSLSGALSEHLLAPDEARRRIDDILAHLDRCRTGDGRSDHYAEVAEVVRSLAERRRLLDVVEAYRERKLAQESLDFADQVEIAARLAAEVPQVGEVERARFRIVLLDEYQDTSFAQVELLAGVFGGGHAVTAVGDPHQSIYGWRGASASGLDRFPGRFRTASGDPAPVRCLTTSWRNDAAILEVANVVSAPLRGGGAAGSPAGAGRLAVPELAVRPGAGAGEVRALVCATTEDEAEAVARFVAERWLAGRPGPASGKDATVGAAGITAAVLCRARSQFPTLEAALRRQGLPVEVVGLGGLLSVPEVVDVVALLQVVHDPSRGDSLMRLLTGPRLRLGAADLHALASHVRDRSRRRERDAATATGDEEGSRWEGRADAADEGSIVDLLDDLPRPDRVTSDGRRLSAEGRRRLAVLAGTLEELRSVTYLPVPELVVAAERALGLDVEVAALHGPRGRGSLDAFHDVATTFAAGAQSSTLGAFLAWLDVAEVQERGLEMPVSEPDPAAVQLITVHAAKGLEWDVVAVAGLVDGSFPTTAASGADGPAHPGWLKDRAALPYPLRGDAADLPELAYLGARTPRELRSGVQDFRRRSGEHQVAEERRLAYVAVTRARVSLLLSASWWRDGVRPRLPSPFLREVVDAGLAGEDGWAEPPVDGAENPVRSRVVETQWPSTSPGRSAAGAALVERARTRSPDLDAPWSTPGLTDDAGHDLGELARLLLLERRDRERPQREIALPAHLSASSLVRLARDRQAYALDLRRPVPSEPSAHARRGTAFHLWVEAFYSASSLVDVDDLPGADDEHATDVALDELQRTFRSSVWAALTPIAVEIDVETPIGGVMTRSRIDAVFPDPRRPGGDGEPAGVVVVDWKTGRAPADPGTARVRQVQLAVYRLAWSRWAGIDLSLVDAAFYYVAGDETVRPAELLDEAGLERLIREG